MVATGFMDSGLMPLTLLADAEHQPSAEEVDGALRTAGQAWGFAVYDGPWDEARGGRGPRGHGMGGWGLV